MRCVRHLRQIKNIFIVKSPMKKNPFPFKQNIFQILFNWTLLLQNLLSSGSQKYKALISWPESFGFTNFFQIFQRLIHVIRSKANWDMMKLRNFLMMDNFEAALDKFSGLMLLCPVKVKSIENKGDDRLSTFKGST